jgi:hypothetical protein
VGRFYPHWYAEMRKKEDDAELANMVNNCERPPPVVIIAE